MTETSSGRRMKVGWSLAGVAIAFVVGYVVYSYVGALVVGLFLYYAVRPVYRRLSGHVDHPDVTAAATLLVVGLPLLGVLAYAGVVGVSALDHFLQQANLEQLRSQLQPYLGLTTSGETNGMVDSVGKLVPQALGFVSAIFTWGVRLFVIVTVSFYLLRDDQKISNWARRTFDDDYGVLAFFRSVDDDLTTIYTGNLITVGVSSLIAVVVYYGLNLIAPQGTKIVFPLLLGLLTGVATLIPGLGMKLVYWPYTAYLGWQSVIEGGVPLWFPVAFFVVTLIVVDTLPDIYVRSYLSKGDHNMGLMLLTYVLGAVVFGWYGIFLGPVVLVLFLHFVRDVLPNLLDAAPDQVVSESQ
ncbi:AI-2E family transporter [Haloarculaceae archaeon H-GB1-1]|nr:AI-2E family transporter [Haloarculaceae archaeon H-GB1-1]